MTKQFFYTAAFAMAFAASGKAELLVYEPFDYPINLDDEVAGALDGKDGATGFSAAWEDMISGSNNGIPFIYDSAGNTNATNGSKPDWDGVINNLDQTGGYIGLSPFSSDQFEDRLNARRTLAQSAGEMAGTDGVLWMSMAVHFEDSRFNFAPGLMLTDGGGFSERVRDITDDSTGIGMGHGSGWGLDVNVITYNAGAFDIRTDISNLSTSTADYVIVLKYEFGSESDTVSGWFFTEDEELSEATFDANALGTTSTFNIDEDTLTTLAVGFTRAGNAYDEIKIGDTFGDVTGNVTAAVGPLVLSISPSISTAGALDFSWEANDGKVYDLVSNTDLSVDLSTWTVWEGQSDIAIGSATGVPRGPEAVRFFALIEKAAPPAP